MKLKYVLVVPNDVGDKDVTFFQGWNPVIRDTQFLRLLSLLSTLPATPEEIFMDQRELIEFRTSGVLRDVSSVGASLLSQLDFGSGDEITVFLALEPEVALIKKTQVREPKKTILLSFSDEDGVIDIRKREHAGYRFIDNDILSLLPPSRATHRTLRGAYDCKVSFPKNHGINAPNLAVLQALGFHVESNEGGSNDSFEEAERLVIDSAKIAFDCIGEVGRMSAEIVLYAPSVKAFFYDFKDNRWNQLLRKVKEKWKRQIIVSCFRNPGYSEVRIEMDSLLTNPYSDPILGPILHERQSEVFATTGSIAVMAANEGLISMRLPNSVNLHGPRLRHLESLAKRADAKAPILLQREFGKYILDLRDAIGPGIAEFVRSNSVACKLCSDVPLEWVYLDQLPLMISHEVSKVPMTPGNCQLQYASMGERIAIRESDCKKILVIRSFGKDDPLLGVMEECLQQFDFQERLDITFNDVQNRDEACAALNAFDGSIVVFDCHGDHGGHDSSGWLRFGKEKINTWELAYNARVPPIVMLSACSTSAIGGSHISVAGGLLRSGAHSVLGTFLPVNGPRSALLIARILARFDTYLPAIKRMGYKFVTWRTFVHSVMKLSYLTDVLVYFRFDLQLIDDDTFTRIEIDALATVGFGRKDWYDLALGTISEACGISKVDLVEKIRTSHPLMETMRYCQVGLPEHIVIILDDALELDASDGAKQFEVFPDFHE
jgi:hypothetical protein